MRRTLVALAVSASFLPTSTSGLFDNFWALLSSLWGCAPYIEAGCGMAPDGHCQPIPSPQRKEGCGMDPSGRCLAPAALAPQPDAGCGMDPSGNCHPVS